MKYSVVIPTNRSVDHTRPLLLSLVNQTLLPSQIVIVLDQYHTDEELTEYTHQVHLIFWIHKSIKITVIHPLVDARFKVWQWASYVRNYGRFAVISPYMMFVDDDNTCDEDFAQKIFEYITDKNYSPDKTIVVPLQYDDTTTYVRAAVADDFSFVLCRPHRLTTSLLEKTDRYQHLMLSSSNCLVWATALFQQYPFDEHIPFVYEDLIMTWRMTKSWIRILCDTWSPVTHAHGNRPKLAELYINTPLRAYYKAKHRIFLIHTIWSRSDKLVFYTIGLRGQTAWLVFHIIRYASPLDWLKLIRALVVGTCSGIKDTLKNL